MKLILILLFLLIMVVPVSAITVNNTNFTIGINDVNISFSSNQTYDSIEVDTNQVKFNGYRLQLIPGSQIDAIINQYNIASGIYNITFVGNTDVAITQDVMNDGSYDGNYYWWTDSIYETTIQSVYNVITKTISLSGSSTYVWQYASASYSLISTVAKQNILEKTSQGISLASIAGIILMAFGVIMLVFSFFSVVSGGESTSGKDMIITSVVVTTLGILLLIFQMVVDTIINV